jgi:hypothetical protein
MNTFSPSLPRQLLDLVTFHSPDFEHIINPPQLVLLAKLTNRYNKNNIYHQFLYIRYTGCPRRNVPDFGRVFLMLKYTDITQNTYVQS